MKPSTTRLAVLSTAIILAAALPAAADTRIEKNLKLEPGGKLTVVSDAGSVEITGKATSGAHVVLTSKDDDLASKFDMTFEELPGEVKIVVKKKSELTSWLSWFRTSGMAFEIQVPTKTRANVSTGGGHIKLDALEGDATVATSGGHIEVAGLKGTLGAQTSGGHITIRNISGDAKIETSGGHIEVDGVDGKLWGETSGGHISVKNVGKDIHVETSGGSIEISGAKGRVDADTSGGHIEVGLAKGNARGGRIESSGGSVTVALDPNVNLNLDASTSAGSVTTDVPVKVTGKVSRSEIRGTLGSGGETLTVSTSGGSVRITPIGADAI
jgi:hypothetical protein